MLSGEGKVTVNARDRGDQADDAVPLNFNDRKSFENTGTAPLELMAVGVVKDLGRKMEIVGANRYGGAGRGDCPGPWRAVKRV